MVVHDPLSSRILTTLPDRCVSRVEGRRSSPCQTHSVLISGSSRNAVPEPALGRPRSIVYPYSSPANPSLRPTGTPRRFVPCVGKPRRLALLEPASGPAHSVEANPPSRASAATAPLREVSANSRNARYRLDFPEPFAPVTTLTRSRGTTSWRIDR